MNQLVSAENGHTRSKDEQQQSLQSGHRSDLGKFAVAAQADAKALKGNQTPGSALYAPGRCISFTYALWPSLKVGRRKNSLGACWFSSAWPKANITAWTPGVFITGMVPSLPLRLNNEARMAGNPDRISRPAMRDGHQAVLVNRRLRALSRPLLMA